MVRSQASDGKHPVDLTRSHLAGRLSELGYLERAAAHVLAGWVPRIVQLNSKVAAVRAAHRHMQRAEALRRQVWALTRLDYGPPKVSCGARSFMEALDFAPSKTALFSGMDSFFRPHLRELYQSLVARCDSLIHEGAFVLCAAALDELQTGLINDGASPSEYTNWLKSLEVLWRARSEGEPLNPEETLWPPRDRVRFPARSSHLRFDTSGALRTIAIDANRSPRAIAINLHRNLDGEYTTMELIARNSYEHPDMPWQFHLDALRQSSDEARHAIMLERLMADYGFKYGDFPINTIGYESIYEFAELDPGCRVELLWRLLLRQTFQEGMALDSLAYEIRRRRHLDQVRYAEVFEFLLADEVFHAESGLRWSTHLLNGDQDAVRAERQKALTAWGTELDRRRESFVQKYPERAFEELRQLEEADRYRNLPFKMTLNVHARLKAGYDEKDLEQIMGWGFMDLPPSEN